MNTVRPCKHMDRLRLAFLSVEQVLRIYWKSQSWECLGEYPFLFFVFPYPNPFVYIQSEAVKKITPQLSNTSSQRHICFSAQHVHPQEKGV